MTNDELKEIQTRLYFDGREYDERYSEETLRIEDDMVLNILKQVGLQNPKDFEKPILDLDRKFTPKTYSFEEKGFASADEAAKHFAERYNSFTLKTVGDLSKKEYGLELGSMIYKKSSR